MDTPDGQPAPTQPPAAQPPPGGWVLAIPLGRDTLIAALAALAALARAAGILSSATAGLLVLGLATGASAASQARIRRS